MAFINTMWSGDYDVRNRLPLEPRSLDRHHPSHLVGNMVAVAKGFDYPDHLLIGCETALIVFAAAFRGLNDASWIADAGLTATCVDNDGDKLSAMADDYPNDWEYVVANAWEWETDRRWDVVSLDPFTQDMQRCADSLPKWCKLARHAVIVGTGRNTVIDVPDGWTVTGTVWRSTHDGGVYWTTLEPA